MSEKIDVIAIDGPAGSGKSTVARKVAQILHWQYIDTGAMYRALTLKHLNTKEDIVKTAQSIKIFLKDDKVYVDDCDVTKAIREQRVTQMVSSIAAIDEVRKIMVGLQRKIAKDQKCVMEGRDIGSVVFPHAKYKFYLDANIDVRAQRRAKEYEEKNIAYDKNNLKAEIIERDKKDSLRLISPLKAMPDAIILDTSYLSIDEVVNKIIGYIKQ